ncbi:MAG: nitric oxide reductase transcriptional regulator NorR [Venatoribacter sp.]
MFEHDLVQNIIENKTSTERYQQLIQTVQKHFDCSAVAILKRHGEILKPIAVLGLVPEVHGRKFNLAQHPRLSAIINSQNALHFPIASPLPDPYDGLLASHPGEILPVHDCMGIGLWFEQECWGVLTLDSMTPGAFDQQKISRLDLSRPFIEATIRINQLEEELQSLRQTNFESESNTNPSYSADSEIVGKSEVIKQIRKELNVVAVSDLPVLLLGEIGVGKEIFANYIHQQSHRVSENMLYLNCATLSQELAEAELFGYIKGAFPGAVQDYVGRIAAAHNGTLFLDEISELSLPAQAKLVHTLQTGEIQRIGSDHIEKINVRIIAATNRNLKSLISEGAFRADLYHRLSMYPVHIPPLRERAEDIASLAGHFLEMNRGLLGVRSLRLSPDAERALMAYSWPGNRRELEQVISRAAIKALSLGVQRHEIVTLDAKLLDLELPQTEHTTAPKKDMVERVQGLSMKDAVKLFQRNLLKQELKENNGSWSATARALQLDPSNLHKLAQKLGVK